MDDFFIDAERISPVSKAKFLGVLVDNKFTFSNHVDSIISKCNGKTFLMLQLKRMAMNTKGLRSFYMYFYKTGFRCMQLQNGLL